MLEPSSQMIMNWERKYLEKWIALRMAIDGRYNEGYNGIVTIPQTLNSPTYLPSLFRNNQYVYKYDAICRVV